MYTHTHMYYCVFSQCVCVQLISVSVLTQAGNSFSVLQLLYYIHLVICIKEYCMNVCKRMNTSITVKMSTTFCVHF